MCWGGKSVYVYKPLGDLFYLFFLHLEGQDGSFIPLDEDRVGSLHQIFENPGDMQGLLVDWSLLALIVKLIPKR